MLVLSVTAITFAGSLQNRLQQSQLENTIVSDKNEIKEEKKNEIKQDESDKKENIQEKGINVVDNKEEKKVSENKDVVDKKSESTKREDKESKSQNTNNDSKNNKTTPQKPNFYIIDTVNNRVIYKGYVDINSKTAGDVTLKVLIDNKISYRAKGTGGSIYFSSIAGLKERDYGANSGWCYYVNGVKPSVGAGSYILKDGDVLEWKYLEDGLK
ncbi:DUF4430 domain-containing protein [Caloramator sp. mosi_1]|uniref:DUF4430 domain-containing protein n=1 Tax=Caloramator sp. mosi_1 TaxID=3023090 RepID=UPI0023605D4D|nr:DUF4430 domain-containing protein [Caloramator sp. mosi_1]WDC85514.1 DUF4430 domain-containing protein [Caloramator sp. mosi_1]